MCAAPLFMVSSARRRALLWRYWITALAIYFIQRESGEPTLALGVAALIAVVACIRRNRAMGGLAAAAYTARASLL